jgi:hypothetical protein
MASINSLTFNNGSGGVAGTYATGDPIQLQAAYTPDTPGVTPETFTATANITDSGGNVVATSSSPFTVNVSQAAGDVVSVTDTGSRTWTQSSDNGSVAVFDTTA